MKRIMLVLALAAVFGISSQAQGLRTPAPSPGQTIKQEFGLSSIELSYSRPGVKGRKIFGDVVPFDKVWRTGANSATTLVFGDDVTIGGKLVPAGKYGLLTIPGKDNWTLIITKQLDVTSPAAYKQENDVVRVQVPVKALGENIESFTMQFSNVKPSSCDLLLRWEKTEVALPITTEIESKIMAQIKNQMENDNRPYFAAAMYYMDNGKDLNKALEWFNKAAEQNPAFYILYQKAVCLSKLGRKQEAMTVSEQSTKAAMEAKSDDYVALNKKLQASLK
jgi:hypothetical protein